MITAQKDLRIIKTYAKLNRAFYEVISEQSFEDFTVFDLCERAGVRRATFYKHFTDKYDFLSFAAEGCKEKILLDAKKLCNPCDSVTFCLEYINCIFTFFENNHHFVENLKGSSAFKTYLVKVTEGCCDFKPTEFAEKDGEYNLLKKFICGGICNILYDEIVSHEYGRHTITEKIRKIITPCLCAGYC